MASKKFGVPSELDNEALEAALAEAHSKGEELAKINNEDFTDDQIAEFTELAAFIDGAKSEKVAREEQAAQRNEQIEALRSTVVIPKKDEDEEVEEVEVDPDGEEPVVIKDEDEDEEEELAGKTETAASKTETASDEAPAEPAPAAGGEAPAEPAGEPEATEEAPAQEPSDNEDPTPSNEGDEEEKENATVSETKKASLSDGASNAPKQDDIAEGSKFSLSASANVPNIETGKKYDSLANASEAISNSIKALPTSGRGVTKLPALTFSLDLDHKQGVSGNDTETLMKAASESRLYGGSLTASGGWAAPSEQLLDFCSIETAEGLIDLPSISVNRGGVNYTKGPSFADVMDAETGHWDITEAQAEAGNFEKTALEPSVPNFTDVRLDAVGVMVEAGLLTRHGWPELVNRYADLAVLKHQVKVHDKLIKGITDYTGEAVPVANGYGNAIDILNIISVVITGERQRFVMGNQATLEVLLPIWVKEVLRADLANRNGVDLLDVSDSRINGWFSSRGARVQWLAQWQNLEYTNGIAQAYPETLNVIAYPAGTYVKGQEDVITLDTIYDSVNLRKNKYVHLFMEQGILVANPCYEGRHFSFPLRANGRTAANDITADFGRAAAADAPAA